MFFRSAGVSLYALGKNQFSGIVYGRRQTADGRRLAVALLIQALNNQHQTDRDKDEGVSGARHK